MKKNKPFQKGDTLVFDLVFSNPSERFNKKVILLKVIIRDYRRCTFDILFLNDKGKKEELRLVLPKSVFLKRTRMLLTEKIPREKDK